MLKWMLSRWFVCDPKTRNENSEMRSKMDWAARSGQLETLKALHEKKDGVCTTYAMDHTAANGHLKVVEWLHANRRDGCTQRAMDCAAANGHLRVVEWLHANRQ